MVGIVCVARVAAAEPAQVTPADLPGRWVSKAAERELTLDISRCGEGWCGVVVEDNACGRVALRVAENPGETIDQPGRPRELVGRLQLAANTDSYGVRAVLSRNDSGALTLFIAGHSGGPFAAYRRTYDYRNRLVRDGDPVCMPEPKSS